jgi:hypothetical protein
VASQKKNSTYYLIKKDIAETLIEIVEEEIHPYTDAIRSRSSFQLSRDFRHMGTKVLEIYTEFGSSDEVIIKSLYLVRLPSSKVCRKNDPSGKASITK